MTRLHCTLHICLGRLTEQDYTAFVFCLIVGIILIILLSILCSWYALLKLNWIFNFALFVIMEINKT